MLNLCESFAYSYGLKFNASKTQLIRFGLSLSNTCNARIVFCGEQLVFLNTVCHLGHHLSYNLSDDEDINRKCHDFLKKANILLVNFKFCSPSTLTFLFRSFCLSLYGCALWRLDSKSISTIEIAFNKVLRRIWNLPANSHTRIVHCTARLTSLFNTILSRSFSLLRSALACPSFPASYIFRASSGLVYTCVGFNTICGNPYKKVYFSEDMYCANVIRNIRLSYGHLSNVELEHIVRVVSSD